ncbi:thioredoxin domain-containing protein [Microbacterium sp. B2969]|uniref:Thioredoxin domain-containing protein n=1 Tax=Microbacterium alkaliflavum TaxID=3248839 RepID=A0ABW7Q639_9MICO
MNPRLAASASPYLRAHADNPVAWHAWGEEAFAEARRRDVPVFVSIGYSTCHWCHVMARESFQDAALAERLNERFVAIKVDREEHPEVDAAYMAAAGAFTQSLGWPLSVFTTPDGGPFYAGTYFPPAPRGGMPSFEQVLDAVHEAWTERREAAEGTAGAIAEALAEVQASAADGGAVPDAAAIVAAARALAAREDPQYGGFWGGDPRAPKFPVATSLRLLQARLVRETAPDATAMAERALAAMAGSELRDPVEGGFFRYATQRDWTVPHYERMLTDNAQLLDVAASAGDVDTVRGIATFLRDVLQQPGGGFGAAQDSESWIDGARSEGGYYARDAAARASLESPAVDGKVVTGWNGLAIGALARAGARLREPEWIEAARWAADAVLTANVRADGALVRASLDEIASRAPATLADHGQLAEGLVALAVATGEVTYADRARALLRVCLDSEGGLRAPAGTDPVLAASGVRAPDAASDADEPSGVAAIAGAAAALWLVGGGEEHRALAERLVAAHAADALAQPLAHSALLRAASLLAAPPRQVVVVGDAAGDLAVAAQSIAADVVAVVSPSQASAWATAGFELFADKTQRDGLATAYDCRDFACRLPVTSSADLVP